MNLQTGRTAQHKASAETPLTPEDLEEYLAISPYGALNAGTEFCGTCSTNTPHVTVTGPTTGITYLICHLCGEQQIA